VDPFSRLRGGDSLIMMDSQHLQELPPAASAWRPSPGAESTHSARLDALLGLFGQRPGDLGYWTKVPGAAIPDPHCSLLVHEGHMTAVLQDHYRDQISLRVLEEHRSNDVYGRKIVLALNRTRQVVEFAVMRSSLRDCSPRLKEAILEGKKSLGLILMEHVARRHVVPEHFLRLRPAAQLKGHFGRTGRCITYGRLATIYLDGQPTMRLLEVVAPNPGDRAPY
jgi:hypothetical protein